MAQGGEVMAHDGRWTGGHCGGASTRRVAGSTTGIRLATTRVRGAGGLGEDGPNKWAPSVNDGSAVTAGRTARARRWAGVSAELGRPQRKWPTMIFFSF
jgi:hypothetical protein